MLQGLQYLHSMDGFQSAVDKRGDPPPSDPPWQNPNTKGPPEQCCRPTWECWDLLGRYNDVKWKDRHKTEHKQMTCCRIRYQQSCQKPQEGDAVDWYEPPLCSNPEDQNIFPDPKIPMIPVTALDPEGTAEMAAEAAAAFAEANEINGGVDDELIDVGEANIPAGSGLLEPFKTDIVAPAETSDKDATADELEEETPDADESSNEADVVESDLQ